MTHDKPHLDSQGYCSCFCPQCYVWDPAPAKRHCKCVYCPCRDSAATRRREGTTHAQP